jgi:hypothetical protein
MNIDNREDICMRVWGDICHYSVSKRYVDILALIFLFIHDVSPNTNAAVLHSDYSRGKSQLTLLTTGTLHPITIL